MSDPLSTAGTLHVVGITTFVPPPMFPSTVTVGDARIELLADGTWRGDAAKFHAALASATQTGEPFLMPVLWLIANAIR